MHTCAYAHVCTRVVVRHVPLATHFRAVARRRLQRPDITPSPSLRSAAVGHDSAAVGSYLLRRPDITPSPGQRYILCLRQRHAVLLTATPHQCSSVQRVYTTRHGTTLIEPDEPSQYQSRTAALYRLMRRKSNRQYKWYAGNGAGGQPVPCVHATGCTGILTIPLTAYAISGRVHDCICIALRLPLLETEDGGARLSISIAFRCQTHIRVKRR